MRRMLLAAMCSLTGLTAASELDLKPGQWSIETKPTEIRFFSVNDKRGSDTNYNVSGGTDFALNLSGKYAIDNALRVGGLISISKDGTLGKLATNGEIIANNRNSQFSYILSPFVFYQLNDTLHGYGELSVRSQSEIKTLDIDNNESLSGNKESEFNVWLGGAYISDLQSNVMLEALSKIGMSSTKQTAANNTNDTAQWNYLKWHTSVDAKYFLASNFSVNAGFGFYYEQKVGEKNDGNDVDLENNKHTVSNYGTRFGFTYYRR